MSEQAPLRSVLFVCTANQCRSPMAAGLLKALAVQRGEVDRWQVQSAGTWAEPDRPATQLSQTVMQQRHIDLTEHRSRSVDTELLGAVHVVLVMTRHHQEALQVEFPAVRNRIMLLSQLVDREFDIEDPFGGSLDDYELCATNLQNILSEGYDRLAEMIDRADLVRR
jgi:protein arginine phosphatase